MDFHSSEGSSLKQDYDRKIHLTLEFIFAQAKKLSVNKKWSEKFTCSRVYFRSRKNSTKLDMFSTSFFSSDDFFA